MTDLLVLVVAVGVVFVSAQITLTVRSRRRHRVLVEIVESHPIHDLSRICHAHEAGEISDDQMMEQLAALYRRGAA